MFSSASSGAPAATRPTSGTDRSPRPGPAWARDPAPGPRVSSSALRFDAPLRM